MKCKSKLKKNETTPTWLKRWENFNAKRVSSKGDFPNMQSYYNEVNNHLKSNGNRSAKTNSLEWVPFGPFSLPEFPNPPYNEGIGRINCVAFHPLDSNTFFIGASQGGVWKTTNNGSSWMPISEQLPTLRISDIAINKSNPDNMYICLGDYAYIGVALDTDDRKRNTHYGMGVFKTNNGGIDWEPTGLSFENTDFDGSLIRRVFISDQNESELVAVGTSGIYKSFDAGDNWNLILDSLMWDIEQSTFDENILYASSGYVQKLNDGSATIMKSTDFGNTWTVLNTGIPPVGVQRVELALSTSDSNYIYAIACNLNRGFGGLYQSTDAGQTWSLKSTSPNVLSGNINGSGTSGQGTYDLSIVVDKDDPETIYVGGVNLWGSTDGGTNWGRVSYWLYTYGESVHADQHQLKIHPITKQYYLCNDGGIYRTSNIDIIPSGSSIFWTTNWENLSNGMNITSFYRIGTSKNNPNYVIAGAQDNSTFYFNGTSWRNTFGGDGMDCAIDPVVPNVIYGSAQYGRFFKSFDEGVSISEIINDNGEWTSPFLIDPVNRNTLYAAHGDISKSTDFGSSWQTISSFPSSPTFGGPLLSSAMKVAESNTNYIYVAKRLWQSTGDNSEMWVTKNGGSTWLNITSGIPSELFITAIETDKLDENHVFITLGGFIDGEKIYESTDAGTTWINISADLPNIPSNCITQVNGTESSKLFVGTDIGVFYKEVGELNWSVLGSGLPNVIVSDLDYFAQDNILYAATFGRGIWTLNLTDFLVFNNNNSVSNNTISLYPNPSKGIINISGLTGETFNYEIVDVTGRMVKKGVNSNPSIDFNLNSGIYWFKILQNNKTTFVKRFVVED